MTGKHCSVTFLAALVTLALQACVTPAKDVTTAEARYVYVTLKTGPQTSAAPPRTRTPRFSSANIGSPQSCRRACSVTSQSGDAGSGADKNVSPLRHATTRASFRIPSIIRDADLRENGSRGEEG